MAQRSVSTNILCAVQDQVNIAYPVQGGFSNIEKITSLNTVSVYIHTIWGGIDYPEPTPGKTTKVWSDQASI